MHPQSIHEIALRTASHGLNYSVIQTLCREHLLKDCQVGIMLKPLRQGLSKHQKADKNLIDFLNVFLFNTCALNQQLICDFENRILQSTEEVYRSHNSKHQSPNLYLQLQVWLQNILTFPFLLNLFEELSLSILTKNRSARQLLSTIDYLTQKYKVNYQHKAKIRDLLQKTAREATSSELQTVSQGVNRLIFCSGEQFISLMEYLNSDYSTDLRDLAKLIASNYVEAIPERNIFKSANLTGSSFIEECIDFIIRKIPKADLFSQKLEHYRPFELLMEVIVQRQAGAMLEWNGLIQQMRLEGSSLHSSKHEEIFRKLSTFLSVHIPNDYPHLHLFFKYTFTSLLAKYSELDALELMKKFALNRFFLNPTFFSLFMNPSESQMRQFIENANSIRILFYQKKVALLISQGQTNRIQQTSSLLIKSFKGMLQSPQNNTQGMNVRDRGIYVNDQILEPIFLSVGQGLGTCSEHRQNHSAYSQSSLSFSLKNDPMKSLSIQSPKQKYTSFHPPRPQPTSTPKRQPVMSKSRASESNNNIKSTQIVCLDELVTMRRQFGEMRKQVRARCEARSLNRQKKLRGLLLMQEVLTDKRVELEHSFRQSWDQFLIL